MLPGYNGLDALIAGSTDDDDDAVELALILAQWTTPGSISGGGIGRLDNVTDDGDADTLYGRTAIDEFWADVANNDLLPDLATGETVNVI